MNRSTPPSTSAFDLLAEDLARFVLARRAVRLEAHAEWSDGAGDERAVARRLARDLRRGAIQLAHLLLQAVLRELQPVRAEAVRLDHVGAGVDVLAMDLARPSRARGGSAHRSTD